MSRMNDVTLMNSEMYDKGYKKAVADMLAGHLYDVRQEKALEPVYGFCPICGAPGYMRERRPDGDDTCVNKHTYKSATAVPTPPQRTMDLDKLEAIVGNALTGYKFRLEHPVMNKDRWDYYLDVVKQYAAEIRKQFDIR